MGKFSFSLPGRKDRSKAGDDSLVAAPPADANLSKAERLLGASNLPVHNYPQQSSLRKRGSHSNLNQQSSDTDDWDEPDYPVPELPSQYRRHEPVSSPHNHYVPHYVPEPSPLSPTFGRPISFSQNNSPRLRPEQSHPRSMSSHAVPAITSITALPQAETYRPVAAHAERHPPAAVRRLGPEINEIPTGLGINVQKKNSNVAAPLPTPKRKPSRLDLSRMLPRGGAQNSASSNHLPLRPRMVSSPTNLVTESSRFPDLPLLPPELLSPVGNKRMIKRRAESVENLRRPRTAGGKPSKATKHWFDGLLEAEDHMEDSPEPNYDDSFTPQTVAPHEFPDVPVVPDIYRSMSKPLPNPRQDLSIRLVEKSSPYYPSVQPVQPNQAVQPVRPIQFGGQSRQIAMGNDDLAEPYLPGLHENDNKNTIHHNSPQMPELELDHRNLSNLSTSYFPKSDSSLMAHEKREQIISLPMPVSIPELQEEDALEEFPPFNSDASMDSDDDEDLDLPGVRASIALSDIDDDVVTIAEAQAFHVRPQEIFTNVQSTESISICSTSSSSYPFPIKPIGTIRPTIQRIHTKPKSVSIDHGKSSKMQQKIHTLPSRPASILTMSPTSSGFKIDTKHKLMAVTEEEEALLAMMRQKRAEMGLGNLTGARKVDQISSINEEEYAISTQSSNKNDNDNDNLLSRVDQMKQPMQRDDSYLSLSTPDQQTRSAFIPINTLYAQLSTSPPNNTSPTYTNLSMSPSNTSQASALSSPTTPHPLTQTKEDVSVVIADNMVSLNLHDDSDIVMENQPKGISLGSSEQSIKTTTTQVVSVGGKISTETTPAGSDDDGSSVGVNDNEASSREVVPKRILKHMDHHRLELTGKKKSFGFENYSGYSNQQHRLTIAKQKQGKNRNSVMDDVMAAWGDLGGCQNLGPYHY